jgi:hypothetical protein
MKQIMKILIKLVALLTIFCIKSCKPVDEAKGRASFYIMISDVHGADGYTLQYLVTEDSLKMFSDCDFEGCKDSLIYRQGLSADAISKFSKVVYDIRIDTLKSQYVEDGFDGLTRRVSYQRNSDKLKFIQLERYDHPIIDSLVSEIRKLIIDKKYREMR